MSNYPDYTWDGDPFAPWNQPADEWGRHDPWWADEEPEDPRTDMIREEGTTYDR